MPWAVIRSDTHTGSSMQKEGYIVTSVVRDFYVKSTGGYSYAALHSAVTAIGMPVPGEKHPLNEWQTPPNELRAIRYDPQPMSSTVIRVLVTYLNCSTKWYQGGVGLEQIQTDREPVSGAIITTEFAGTVENPVPSERQKQAGVITVNAAQEFYTVSRIQANALVVPPSVWPGGINPREVARDYTNHVNSEIWMGNEARTWLCENVNYDNTGLGNIAWNMRYELRYRESTWDAEAIWIDRDTGEPGYGVTEANGGRVKVLANHSRDFNDLNIEIA